MTNETQRRTYKELLKAYDQVITERDSWKRWCEEAEAKRALSPCACGGETPAAEIAAWMDADVHASLSALAAPFRLPRSGAVYLYGEDSRIGNHRKPVRVIIFDLPGGKP